MKADNDDEALAVIALMSAGSKREDKAFTNSVMAYIDRVQKLNGGNGQQTAGYIVLVLKNHIMAMANMMVDLEIADPIRVADLLRGVAENLVEHADEIETKVAGRRRVT